MMRYQARTRAFASFLRRSAFAIGPVVVGAAERMRAFAVRRAYGGGAAQALFVGRGTVGQELGRKCIALIVLWYASV